MATRAGVFGLALGVAFSLGHSPCHAQDTEVGAIWMITYEAKNQKTGIVRRFRAAPDGKVWDTPKNETPKVVGSWSGDESKTSLEIVGAHGRGTYEIVQTGKNPPSWQGTAKFERNGKSRPVKVRLLED